VRNAKHSKETLDTIGRRLIESDVISANEIERIVSQPYLFARVRKDAVDKPVRRSLRVRYAYAFSAMVILIAATVGIVSLFRKTAQTEISKLPPVQVPAALPVATRPDNLLPPQGIGSDPSPGRVAFREPASMQKITARTANYAQPREKQPVRESRQVPEFYAINPAGVAEENVAGGHIVRVEMPRASLFALGVNVPLENDSETVKADLLVGSDGVTRAIRVVK
jgi:hypothetical protein